MGSDIREGQTVLGRGERVGPAEVGLLATIGAARVQARAPAAAKKQVLRQKDFMPVLRLFQQVSKRLQLNT